MRKASSSKAEALPMLMGDEQRYRAIFEHAIEGIFQTTPDGRYVGANPALARLYGYGSAAELQAAVFDIGRQLYVDPARRSEFQRVIEERGSVENFESAVYRQDGSTLWISENAVAVRDAAGGLLYYEGFVVDVSARRSAEEALLRTREVLETSLAELRATQQQIVQTERLRALGEMVTGLAHDFNNALSLIVGYAQIMRQECRNQPVSPEFGEYAQTIVNAALDAAEIVAQMQEFHRPTQPGELAAVLSLNRIIEESVVFTRPRWEAEARGRGMPIELVTELGEIAPLAGNAAELRGLLTNLIFNAVDAMSQGGTISITTRMNAEGAIELAVADDGVGMSEETRRRCLEPFFTTKGPRGNGLGLAMVYGIVQRHDGNIAVESQLGRGSRFVLTFPADRSGALAAPAEPAPFIRPLRILVVDDHPVQSELIAHALSRDWHTVATASDGDTAVARFEIEPFDLVITDKVMPGMNGDQLAAAIKAREPSTPVILLTGLGSPLDSGEEFSEFIDLVLPKPATINELRAAIAKVMQ